MPIGKKRKRYGGVADLEEQAIRLFHLLEADFPGISFGYEVKSPGQIGVSKKTIADTRGKLRLDQNDGTPLPDDQYPNALLIDGSRSLLNDLPVEDGKKVDSVDISGIVDNIINEPRDKERYTTSTSYAELTRWRFRKGQHKTVYLAFEAKDMNNDGDVKITFSDGSKTEIVHEQSGIAASWSEYTASKDISSLNDSWCEIILEAQASAGIMDPYLYVRRFTITARRT
jgi:hypothetical protein